MQRVTLICVGKLGQAFLQQGCDEYTKRLSALCKLQVVELPEETIHEKAASDKVIEKALEKEGARILAALPKGAALVTLCIEGKLISSEDLAAFFADIDGNAERFVAVALHRFQFALAHTDG